MMVRWVLCLSPPPYCDRCDMHAKRVYILHILVCFESARLCNYWPCGVNQPETAGDFYLYSVSSRLCVSASIADDGLEQTLYILQRPNRIPTWHIPSPFGGWVKRAWQTQLVQALHLVWCARQHIYTYYILYSVSCPELRCQTLTHGICIYTQTSEGPVWRRLFIGLCPRYTATPSTP